MKNRLPLSDLRLEPSPFSRFPFILRRVLLWLFLLQTVVVILGTTGIVEWRLGTRWPEGVLIVLGTALLMTSLATYLPVQNLIALAALAMFIGGAAHTLNAWVSIPFGPCSYLRNAGQFLFPHLPWPFPVLWLLIPLCARGTARCMLERFRGWHQYGYVLLGLTVLLITWFSFALEPFAQAREMWSWELTKLPVTWYSAPVTAFVGWALVGFLVVMFITPFLIVKRPGHHKEDLLPLLVWSALHAILTISAALRYELPAAVVAAAALVIPPAMLCRRTLPKVGKSGV